ncbi:MAG: hypothetical protein AAF514_03190 [Verrucomicrobiota bacterium]
MFDSVDELEQSALGGGEPPAGMSEPVKALWYCKAGKWHEAHDVAQDLGSKMGDWIHAHLHLVEGDIGNAGYWYARAGKPPQRPSQIDEEWRVIAAAALNE